MPIENIPLSVKKSSRFFITVIQWSAIAALSLLCTVNPSYGVPPHELEVLDWQWFEHRSLDSDEFRQAANQVLSDAKTLKKMQQSAARDARMGNLALCGLGCAAGAALICSSRLNADKLSSRIMAALARLTTGYVFSTQMDLILLPSILGITRAEFNLAGYFPRKQEEFAAIDLMYDHWKTFYWLLNSEEFELLIRPCLDSVKVFQERIKKIEELETASFDSRMKNPFLCFGYQRKMNIGVLARLFTLKRLENFYRLLEKTIERVPPEVQYKELRESILQGIVEAPGPIAGARDYERSALIQINTVKQALDVRLTNSLSAEEFAQEKQDRELLHAIAQFKKTLCIDVKPYLPSNYPEDYSCPICLSGFELADHIIVACNHCSSGLLHVPCLEGWKQRAQRDQNPSAEDCTLCGRPYESQRSRYIGERSH
jgi:hypothetical protein